MAVEESRGGRKVVPQRDTLWLSSADAVNLAFGIAIHVVLTRAFLSDDYGTFVLLLDFFHVCVILVDLGLPTLIGRDGERLGKGLKQVLHRISRIQIQAAVAAMLVFPVIGWYLFVNEGDWGWFEVALLLCFSAVVQVITYAHRTALRAVGEARLEAFVRIADRGTVAILMVGFASGELLGFAIATAVGPLVALALALYLYLSKVAPQASDSGDEPPDTAEMGSQQLVEAGLPFLFASAALVVNVRIEKLLLGVFATPTDVAEFQIAWLGFIAGYGPILSLRAILLSWFGEVRNDLEKLKHRYKRALFACTLLSSVGAIIGVGVGPFAFEALFPDYAESVQRPFLALMLAWLFHAMASPSLALIQVGDRPWNYTRILWTGIAVSSVACLYLIPTQPSAVMGAAGAAALASLVVLALAFAVAGRGGSAATEETDVAEQQPDE